MNAQATAVQTVDQITAAIGPAVDVYNRLNVIRNVLAPDLNDQELQLFAIVAERSRLDPFAKQIYAIKRGGRVTFQTGIDGFRSSAEETGEYRGSDEPEFGPMIEQPFPHPEWARVVVHREFPSGKALAQAKKVYWDEYYPGSGDNGAMYRKMPRNQLAKCAEAGAFRLAFPKRFSDVYTPEEMAQADAADAAKPVGPTARERIAARRADLEHKPEDAPATDQEELPPTPAADPVTGEILEDDGFFAGPVAATEDAGRQKPKPTADDVVTRLKRVYYANKDKESKPYTAEQKEQLRELFAGVEPATIGALLEAAFGVAATGGRFTVSRAQAIALLEVGNHDRELFIVEASSLAAKAAA